MAPSYPLRRAGTLTPASTAARMTDARRHRDLYTVDFEGNRLLRFASVACRNGGVQRRHLNLLLRAAGTDLSPIPKSSEKYQRATTGRRHALTRAERSCKHGVADRNKAMRFTVVVSNDLYR
jgi:hypothetical protein